MSKEEEEQRRRRWSAAGLRWGREALGSGEEDDRWRRWLPIEFDGWMACDPKSKQLSIIWIRGRSGRAGGVKMAGVRDEEGDGDGPPWPYRMLKMGRRGRGRRRRRLWSRSQVDYRGKKYFFNIKFWKFNFIAVKFLGKIHLFVQRCLNFKNIKTVLYLIFYSKIIFIRRATLIKITRNLRILFETVTNRIFNQN